MINRRIAFFLMIVCLLGAMQASARGTSTPPSQGEWGILFESNQNGRNGLYWIQPDNNQVDQIVSYDTLLKTYRGFANGFNLSPDGKQIAISVSVMSFDKSSIYPSGIYLFTPATTQTRQMLTYTDSVTLAPISWSPDGKSLAFCSIPVANQVDQSLKIINTETLEVKTVMHPWSIFQWQGGTAITLDSGCASWLDEDTLLFAATVIPPRINSIVTASYSALFEIEADGSNLRQITPNGMDALFSQFSGLPVNLLHEKSEIVYLCHTDLASPLIANHICEMDMNTLQSRQVVNLGDFSITAQTGLFPVTPDHEVGEPETSSAFMTKGKIVHHLDTAPDGRIVLNILTTSTYLEEIYLYDPAQNTLTDLTAGSSIQWFYRTS